MHQHHPPDVRNAYPGCPHRGSHQGSGTGQAEQNHHQEGLAAGTLGVNRFYCGYVYFLDPATYFSGG
jgi:hypothetical protein